MNTSELVTPTHLARKAIIYIRQSTPHQVLSNQESLRLQYALEQRVLKAQRGELALHLPVGLVRDEAGRVRQDPHQEVQERIHLVFDSFLRLRIRCQDIVHNPCIQDIVQFYVSCIRHIG